jgi:hypothetical protein
LGDGLRIRIFLLLRALTVRRHTWTVGAAVVGALTTAAVLLLARNITFEPHLAAPQHLSATVRALLDRRMARHVRDMSELERAIIVIDLANAAQIADRIAAEPLLSRPLSSDATELNAQLPEQFFILQDQLRVEAHELTAAARSGDLDRTAQSYGRLARGCLACHAVYLRQP